MEMFAGFVLCLFLEFLGWATYVFYRRATRPLPVPPQPPPTAAQLANRAVYEAEEANHARMVSMHVQRRTRRGWRARDTDDEERYNPFFDE
jgi:hypothetical protein